MKKVFGMSLLEKCMSIVFMLTMITSCLTGRCWDTPGKESVNKNSLPDFSRVTLYIDGNVYLIQWALNEANLYDVELKNVEKGEDLKIAIPLIKVIIQPPAWRENGFTVPSEILSLLTFSIIPGYMYQSSDVIFRLTLPNKSGSLITTDYSYTAKRHYVSWLPLLVVGNFTSTVQVFSQPDFDWDTGYMRIVQQFFRDAKPAFGEYRAWLDSKSN
jgi:hypothetical protein